MTFNHHFNCHLLVINHQPAKVLSCNLFNGWGAGAAEEMIKCLTLPPMDYMSDFKVKDSHGKLPTIPNSQF